MPYVVLFQLKWDVYLVETFADFDFRLTFFSDYTFFCFESFVLSISAVSFGTASLGFPMELSYREKQTCLLRKNQLHCFRQL